MPIACDSFGNLVIIDVGASHLEAFIFGTMRRKAWRSQLGIAFCRWLHRSRRLSGLYNDFSECVVVQRMFTTGTAGSRTP